MIGMSTEQEQLLRSIFASFLPGVEVWVFGSRVKGPIKRSSDLDLALYSKTHLNMKALALLEDALSEAALPFRVECVDVSSITPEFKAHIEQCRERFI